MKQVTLKKVMTKEEYAKFSIECGFDRKLCCDIHDKWFLERTLAGARGEECREIKAWNNSLAKDEIVGYEIRKTTCIESLAQFLKEYYGFKEE